MWKLVNGRTAVVAAQRASTPLRNRQRNDESSLASVVPVFGRRCSTVWSGSSSSRSRRGVGWWRWSAFEAVRGCGRTPGRACHAGLVLVNSCAVSMTISANFRPPNALI